VFSMCCSTESELWQPLVSCDRRGWDGIFKTTWSPYQTGQTKRKHKRLTRLQESNWKEHVAVMEKIFRQYWLSVMIRAKAWSGEIKVTFKIRRWP